MMDYLDLLNRIFPSRFRGAKSNHFELDANKLFIFMHIPKTGGTTMKTIIENSSTPDSRLPLYGKHLSSDIISSRISDMTEEQRRKISIIYGHQVFYDIHNLFDKEPLYFTFLRNPVTRVISDYFKILRTPTNEFHDRVNSNNYSLYEYLANDVSPYIKNHQTVFLARDYIDNDHNADMCSKCDSTLYSRAINNLAKFWFIGLTESCTQDIKTLCSMICLNCNVFNKMNVRPNVQSQSTNMIPVDIQNLILDRNVYDVLLYNNAVSIHDSLLRSAIH